jgi:glycosyltransferase involved in cell wall biosynthesis
MIVFAVNVHSGGGRVLLDSLLLDQPFGPISAAFLDSRYETPQISSQIKIFKYDPTVRDRIRAQTELKSFCQELSSQHDILFFGNNPPFFKMNGKRIVYLQNCFLLSGVPLPKDFIFEMVRNAVERMLLKIFRKNIDELWVQTNWMVDLCRKNFPSISTLKKPFLPILPQLDRQISKPYDFICVTTESTHKNLKPLVHVLQAMEKTTSSNKENKPHFLFVVPSLLNQDLVRFFNSEFRNLKVTLSVAPSREYLLSLYQQSRSIIVPSEYESFCLPLYEGHHFKLGVIAHDRPFFREAGFVNLFINVHDPSETAKQLQSYLKTKAL